MVKLLLAASGILLLAAQPGSPKPAVSASDAPVYTAAGDLVAPTNYREWIYLTSGIDMSYTATATDEHHMFDNVFVNPSSYAVFKSTGTWPDQTTFILEIRGAQSPISINKRGHTQSTEVMGIEIHVKDKGKWSFYERQDKSSAAKLIPPPASCYTCHEAHAAVDTTFVQFYPTLFPIAEKKKTFSAAFLKEMAEPVEAPKPATPGPTATAPPTK